MGDKITGRSDGNALTSSVNGFLASVTGENCRADCMAVSFTDKGAERIFNIAVAELCANRYFIRMLECADNRLKAAYGFPGDHISAEHVAADLLMRLAYYKLTGRYDGPGVTLNLSYINLAVEFILRSAYNAASGGKFWRRKIARRDIFRHDGNSYFAFDVSDAAAYRCGSFAPAAGYRAPDESSQGLSTAFRLFETAGVLNGFRAEIKRFLGIWLEYFDGAVKNASPAGRLKKFDKHGFCVLWHSLENHLFDPDGRDLYAHCADNRFFYTKNDLSKYYERIAAMKRKLRELKAVLEEFELSAADKVDVIRNLYRLL